MADKFNYQDADENGSLVEIGKNDAAYKCSTFDPKKDYAILYPNGQFRRIILDAGGFKNLLKDQA